MTGSAMKTRKEVLEKIHPVGAAIEADSARPEVARVKVNMRPQPGGSKSTGWDRHRQNHFRAAAGG
jgi:hypothetical protein